MKVNFGSLNNYSNVARNKSVSFGSGVTNIFSDFDGTFMPVNFNQDSMVKNNPPLDKAAFASYFAGFQKLLDALKGSGSNPKLNFSIITGVSLLNSYITKETFSKFLSVYSVIAL